MDIILIVVIFLAGYMRITTGHVLQPSNNIIVNEVTGEVCKTYSNLEVGTNLMLNRELGAFTKIVEELKLKK